MNPMTLEEKALLRRALREEGGISLAELLSLNPSLEYWVNLLEEAVQVKVVEEDGLLRAVPEDRLSPVRYYVFTSSWAEVERLVGVTSVPVAPLTESSESQSGFWSVGPLSLSELQANGVPVPPPKNSLSYENGGHEHRVWQTSYP